LAGVFIVVSPGFGACGDRGKFLSRSARAMSDDRASSVGPRPPVQRLRPR